MPKARVRGRLREVCSETGQMGTIVTLPPPRRKRVSAVPTTNKATILLFMGVRYVRELEAAASDDMEPATMPDRAAACPPLETA